MDYCLIYNYAQHYRTNIFLLMDHLLDIEFYFGDKMDDVKKMDYTLLRHNVTEVKNRQFKRIEWQSGVVGLAFRNYRNYIVLGSPTCLSTWLLLILARLVGKKTFLWSHGLYGREQKWKLIIEKAFFGLASGTFLYGNYAKEIMVKHGFSSRKLFVIHNSLYYDKQVQVRNKLSKSPIFEDHFNNRNPNLFFVGRLTSVKKLDQVIKAISICREMGHFYNLTFIGDGEKAEDLKKLTRELGLEKNTWFYGACYDETEIGQLIYNADLCVAPGNIGLTAMHTLVFGTPAITHNDFKWQMPEFEAIKDGLTGSFFVKDDILSLANTINRWFNKLGDKREFVRKECMKEIDESWNPYFQIEVMKSAFNSL